MSAALIGGEHPGAVTCHVPEGSGQSSQLHDITLLFILSSLQSAPPQNHFFRNLSSFPSLPCLFPPPILFSRMDRETIGASMGDTRIVWLSIHTLLLFETIWSMRWLFCTQTHFSTNQATGSLRWVVNYFCQRDENGKPCCTSSSITRRRRWDRGTSERLLQRREKDRCERRKIAQNSLAPTFSHRLSHLSLEYDLQKIYWKHG